MRVIAYLSPVVEEMERGPWLPFQGNMEIRSAPLPGWGQLDPDFRREIEHAVSAIPGANHGIREIDSVWCLVEVRIKPQADSTNQDRS